MLDSVRDTSAATEAGPPAADGGTALVELKAAGFDIGKTRVLDDLSVGLRAGGPIVLLGPNGAGKTTLLKLAMGLIAPSRGEVARAKGRDGRPLPAAFVFQRPTMLRRSAAANLLFALKAAGRPADMALVEELLARVRLTGVANRPARRLSGGEHQRLALARALALSPRILFLDEPTSSLDPAAAKGVEEIIRSLAASGITIVLSTHDLGQARRLASRILFLVGGRLVEDACARGFFAEPGTETARRFLAGDIVL
jgi:tungstate transport system ATP-binding protein